MSQALRVICLEDDLLDAQLIRAELGSVLPDPDWRHVMTEADYRRQLEQATPDLILADYNLPGFDGMSALAIARQLRPHTPFIFVSGALGEEIAIETLKSGATDYVLKNRLKRLGPAVQRALAEARERYERRRAERELEAQRNLLEALINTIPDLIYAVDRQGAALIANRALLQTIGHVPAEVLGTNIAGLMLKIPGSSERRGKEDAELMESGDQVFNRERLWRMPGGQYHWFSTSKTLLREPNSSQVIGLVCVSRDVTANRVLEQELSEISNREQRRIGSDLHDGLGQELTGLSLMLKGIETAVLHDAPQLNPQITRIRDVLTQAIESTRALARGLAPVNLERGGLTSALEHLARQCNTLYGLRCEYRGGLAPDTALDETPATHIYRIAQEAMANAAKHARAKTIVVSLTAQKGGLLLEVSDDGRGIPQAVQRQPAGMGLKLMEYRARIIGGELSIARGTLGGTTIGCFCPLSPTGRFLRPRGVGSKKKS